MDVRNSTRYILRGIFKYESIELYFLYGCKQFKENFMSDFTNKIAERFNDLTPSQKTVANYFIDNPSKFAFSTLEEIAMKIEVSTTTIIRFARMMGYNGYTEMQKECQKSLVTKVSLPDRLLRKSEGGKPDQLLMDTMQNNIADITTTISQISPEDLTKATESISNARNVYVLGMRSSFSLAHYMLTRVGQIRPNVRLVQSVGMIFPEELIGCNEQDVAIVFFFPRYSKTTANLILWLRKRNVKIILFTGQNISDVADYGDVFLPCSVGGISYKNSYVAPMCLIDYMAASIAQSNHQRALETLKEMEEFLNKGYYLGL